MRKNIQHIKLQPSSESKAVDTTTVSQINGGTLKQTYSEADIAHLEHIGFGAGFAPYLRGNSATMYVTAPWDTLKFTDLSAATTSADTVEEMKTVLSNIPADTLISLKADVLFPSVFALFIAASEQQGLKPEQLFGMLQINALDTLMGMHNRTKKTFTDFLEYTGNNPTGFGTISISGCQMREAGATPQLELAYTLALGLEYIRLGIAAGMSPNNIIPRLSFTWGAGTALFTEVAKQRAGRMLWAKLMQQFYPGNEKALALKIHSQTCGQNFTAHDPFNNVTRTTIAAVGAIFGGTESLTTNAFDYNISQPNDFSTRLAHNTQLFLKEETAITKTVDPWGGSYYIESLTQEIAQQAWVLIEEIESAGGMSNAIEAGIPKMRFEEAHKQKHATNGEAPIVGVSLYAQRKEKATFPNEPYNEAVLLLKAEKLEKNESERNNTEVTQSLVSLKEAVKNSNGNIITLAVEAARNMATRPEINNALTAI